MIVLVVVVDSSVSFTFVLGFVKVLLCLTVTLPVGRRPLLPSYAFFSFVGSKVTLVSLSSALFSNVYPARVKVTSAPGVTLVTVIPLFGRPPVLVT